MKYYRLKVIYLLLFALLITLRMLYEGGEKQGGIWNIFQGVFVLTGLILLIRHKSYLCQSSPIKSYVLFSLYIFVISIPYLFNFSLTTLFYYIVIPFGAMSTVVFYYLYSKTTINHGSSIVIISFLVFAMLFFIKRKASFEYNDVPAMVANAYYVVCLLPIVLMYSPKKYSYIPFIVAFIVVLFSGKRAGLLALSIVLFLFYYESDHNVHSKVRSFIALAAVFVAVTYLSAYFRDHYNVDVFTRMKSLSEDGGSGRDRIWMMVFGEFFDSSVLQMVFGHGYKSMSELRGGEAHNDFIQILYENGVVALLLYVYFYIDMFKTWRKMRKNKFPYSKYFLSSLVIALFMANFSFFIIEPRVILCCSLCWGVLLSEWRKYCINYC